MHCCASRACSGTRRRAGHQACWQSRYMTQRPHSSCGAAVGRRWGELVRHEQPPTGQRRPASRVARVADGTYPAPANRPPTLSRRARGATAVRPWPSVPPATVARLACVMLTHTHTLTLTHTHVLLSHAAVAHRAAPCVPCATRPTPRPPPPPPGPARPGVARRHASVRDASGGRASPAGAARRAAGIVRRRGPVGATAFQCVSPGPGACLPSVHLTGPRAAAAATTTQPHRSR